MTITYVSTVKPALLNSALLLARLEYLNETPTRFYHCGAYGGNLYNYAYHHCYY